MMIDTVWRPVGVIATVETDIAATLSWPLSHSADNPRAIEARFRRQT